MHPNLIHSLNFTNPKSAVVFTLFAKQRHTRIECEKTSTTKDIDAAKNKNLKFEVIVINANVRMNYFPTKTTENKQSSAQP